MAIGNTEVEAADRWGGGVHFPQRRGGQEAATRSGEGSMDLKVNTEARGSEGSVGNTTKL